MVLKDYFAFNEGSEEKYRNLVKNYEFTDDLPKGKMYVKLNPNCTIERREFISNGIRSFFRDDTTILLDLQSSSRDI